VYPYVQLAVVCQRKWPSSRLLELSVYAQIEVGGMCSIRRNEIVTVLTRNSSVDFDLGAAVGRI
jgi:hypothetical protein